MVDAREELLGALDAIDPSTLDYQQWCEVGMALHHEGCSREDWRSWSMRDAKRFNERDFEVKWRSFGNSYGKPVTGGTIFKMAVDRGWRSKGFEYDKPHRALSWDSEIGGGKSEDEPVIVDADMVGDFDAEIVPMYESGEGEKELEAFVNALYEPNEIVGYVLDFEQKVMADGTVKLTPSGRGVYSRTAGEITKALSNGMESAIGTPHDESGAWWRINPLDGNGIGNANVTDFRYALLESDEMPQGKFAAIVKQLNLPVAAMVDSGNKSLHAVVRIGAADMKQYAERVMTLYARCEKNGIKVDRQNKNPSRLMRLPGVTRNGKRQFLAGLAQGASDWDEWDEWYAAETDELPDTVSLEYALEHPEPLNPALIEGVTRIGHKMLLSGPSKAGKSFALVALSIAFAEGWSWMGLKCRQSRVLYVNLEVDGKSCIQRFSDVYDELERRQGTKRKNVQGIDVWNLRGKAEPMSKLLSKMVRRAKKNNSEVVIIDPIYKIMVGDENSAADMTAFSNLFDMLCDQAGVSVIYCHHHSKGFQGGKRSIDRASGSGVFGRDPDTILDMTELDVDSGIRWKHANDLVCAECAHAVVDAGRSSDWANLDKRTREIESNALHAACDLLPGPEAARLVARCEKIKARSDIVTAWRISATLREFEGIKPIDVWFDWPLFTIDLSLAEVQEVGAEEPKKKHSGGGGKEQKPKMGVHGNEPIEDSSEIYAEINKAIEDAVNVCGEDGVEPTRKNIHKRIQDVQGKKPEYRQICRWTDSGKTWAEWVPGGFAKGSSRNEKVIVRRGDAR